MKLLLRLAQARARVIRALATRTDASARERAFVDVVRALEGVRDAELWSADRAMGLPMASPFGGSRRPRDDGLEGWAVAIEAATLDLTDVGEQLSRLLVVPLWAEEHCLGALAVRTDGRPDQDTLDQIRALAFCASELIDVVRDQAPPWNEGSRLSEVFAAIVELEPRTLAIVDVSAGALPLFGQSAPDSENFISTIAEEKDRARLERCLIAVRPTDPPQRIAVRGGSRMPWSRIGIDIVPLADRVQCILHDRTPRDVLDAQNHTLETFVDQAVTAAAAYSVSLNAEVERVITQWRDGPGQNRPLDLDLTARDDFVSGASGALEALLWTLLSTSGEGGSAPRIETADAPGRVFLRVSPATPEPGTGRQIDYLVAILEGALDRTLSENGEIRLEISLPTAETPTGHAEEYLPVETRGS